MDEFKLYTTTKTPLPGTADTNSLNFSTTKLDPTEDAGFGNEKDKVTPEGLPQGTNEENPNTEESEEYDSEYDSEEESSDEDEKKRKRNIQARMKKDT